MNLLRIRNKESELILNSGNGYNIQSEFAKQVVNFTMNTISFSRTHYLHCDFSLNSSSVSRIHLESTILFCETTINSLWNNHESTMTSLWIHYLLQDFTGNSSSFSLIHYLFSNSPWIHYPFRGITMNLLSFSLEALGKHYLFWEFTFTIEHYRFREITIKSLFISWITIHQKSFSWIRIESTIFSTNHFWIQYLFRELKLNWPSIY